LKKKIVEQKKKKMGSIIALIIIATIIVGGIYYYNQQKISEANVQWQNISGPFAINKFQYKLDENIFIIVSNLKPNEAGKITVIDPKGNIYSEISFNGTLKSSFHQFFKPNTGNVGIKICTPAELVGYWKIMFQGVPYHPISFNITNDWIPGGQSEIQSIPPDLCK
jgi:hypothetical protein